MQEWTINNSKYAHLPHSRKVNRYEGKVIRLLTLDELRTLQSTSPTTILITIFGDEEQAKDVNDDTRGGYVAAGFLKT